MRHSIHYDHNLDNELRFLVAERQLKYQEYMAGDEIEIDLMDVGFVTPFCLLGILSTCRRLSSITGNKILLCNLSPKLYQYMLRMNFFEAASAWVLLVDDFSEIIPWEVNPLSTNLIEVTRIDSDKIEGARDVTKVASILREREKAILELWLGKGAKEVDNFVTLVSEICQNIFEWSDDFGFVALNKYEYRNKVTLNLSIIDNGIGLYKRVKPKLDLKDVRLEHPSQYLKYPFDTGIARSKGGGLKKVYDFIIGWSGSLFVRSGNSFIFKKIGLESFEARDNEQEFIGTHIGIWFERRIRLDKAS